MNTYGNRLFVTLLMTAVFGSPMCAKVASPGGRGAHAEVYTTAQRQILPIGLSADTPKISPSEVALYSKYGYSAWQFGAGLPYELRTELAPGYRGAPNAASLLSFFSISDAHITDKESPAQPLCIGWAAPYGPRSAGLSAIYSPVILSTTQVLDSAVQTINALNRKAPFDFGISLGDDINNTQYNELRWFIDVLDGKVITPSSGAHAGADSIDYQMPFKAAGLDKAIPWYQVIGNHDQFWAGFAYETTKSLQTHVGDTVMNLNPTFTSPDWSLDQTGIYTGVIDGTTPYGNVIEAGPETAFPTPPTVVPDVNRRSLVTSESSTQNWMREFFVTTSKPAGHGFTRANLAADSACYSFEPKAGIPIKVIVLDDTCKGNGRQNYAAGSLDEARIDWLISELNEGQRDGKLMIIAAHIPILPQTSLSDATITQQFCLNDPVLLRRLHDYPNLILWISGHRHLNVVTAQPDPLGHPANSFWEVETASLRDFPQQFRTVDIRRNGDNTISIFVTDVDPAVTPGSPADKSRGYAIGAARTFGATPAIISDTTSHAYNAELVKQLTPEMQRKVARFGSRIAGR
jgi:metallophosphoesterase (TIGR03768 family)